MRRRSRAGGKSTESQRRKTTTLKRRNAPKAVRRRSSSVAGKEAKVALFKRERDEALEREKASAEVLRIISTSPGELKPIFQAMLENAVRVCEAFIGNLYLRDADGFHMVAAHHGSPAYVAARMSDPLLRPPPDAPLGRLAIDQGGGPSRRYQDATVPRPSIRGRRGEGRVSDCPRDSVAQER